MNARSRLALVDDAAFLDARRYDDTPSAPRSEAERDRDRVLYCSAFQRLGHVTQVTASETGLIFHSRLTHSLKVAQFARRLAERLKHQLDVGEYDGPAKRAVELLDPAAAEAAALAHDLGHPPFGHLAEEALNEAASEYGGFEGNAQSFRVVTRLAQRTYNYHGLNLTRRTLNGVLKYPWTRESEDEKRSAKWNTYGGDDLKYFDWVREGNTGQDRTLEAEIMDWADDVTYAVHDIDDFYRAGLVPLDRLAPKRASNGTDEKYDPHDSPEFADFVGYIRAKAKARVRDSRKSDRENDRAGNQLADSYEIAARRVFSTHLTAFDGPYRGTVEDRATLRMVTSGMITIFIGAATVESSDGDAWFVVDERRRVEVDVLKLLIWFYVIERPSLALLQSGHRRIVTELFRIYSAAALDPKKHGIFPPGYRERLKSAGPEGAKVRVVVDFVAGLTEDGATQIYRKVMGTNGGSIIDAAGALG